MRKDQAEKTEPRSKTENTSVDAGKSLKGGKNPLVIMGIILLLAAFVRVIFSYGVSAGSGFALSGGTVSSDNLHLVEGILSGKFSLTDSSLYYPYGSVTTASLLFNMIAVAFGAIFQIFTDVHTASSLALAVSGPLFGVLACIPMYYLGKLIFGSKLAGYLSALFLALCPIAVRETVFSNGTGTSFTLLLFLIAILFVVKMAKSIEYGEFTGVKSLISQNKSATRYSVIAGALLALTALSWTGFRAILLPIIVVMVIQVLVDRFTGKDPMPAALMYSFIVLIAVVISGACYFAVGLWDLVISGTVISGVFACAFVVAFAAVAKKPWTFTIPVFIIVAAAILLIMSIVTPDVFTAVISGNSAVAGTSSTTLSMIAAYYGWITMWCVYAVVLYMLWKVKENVSSVSYIFTMVWLFAVTLFCTGSTVQAAIATPVFALGFAATVIYILDHVDFKTYFSNIKTAQGAKFKLKRLVKPVPFVTILVAILLVAAPNLTNVIDASISSNEASDVTVSIGDRELIGGLNYYVQTDDSWKIRDVMTSLNGDISDAGMASWYTYSDDIVTYGGGLSVTDTRGNGLETVSNILLNSGTNGASIAAMLVSVLMYSGMTDEVKTALKVDEYLSESDLKLIEDVLNDVSTEVDYNGEKITVKELVLTDVDTYGTIVSSVSDENVKYLFLSNYLAENYGAYKVQAMYDNVILTVEKSVKYVTISSDMFPMFYGYSSTFMQLAAIGGHNVSSDTAVTGLTTVDGYTQYYGVYSMTDAMYDSFLYRAYMGMTPSEAGYSSLYEYIVALSSANASVNMYPGYGLTGYEVIYWQVMYSPNIDAKTGDDSWVQMDGKEAVAKQKTDGGLINYLSGIPIVLKYVGANGTEAKTGSVTDAAGNGVEGVRVTAIGANGYPTAIAFTDANGKFTICVDNATAIMYYLGSTGITGGVYLGSVGADAVSNEFKIDTATSLTVYLNTAGVAVDGYDISFVGTDSANTFTFKAGVAQTIPFDTYTVTITEGSTKILDTKFTPAYSKTQSTTFAITGYDVTITAKNVYGQPLTGEKIVLTGKYTITSDAVGLDGTVKVNVPAGDYTVSFASGKYAPSSATMNITSSSSKSVTGESAITATVKAQAGAVVYASAMGGETVSAVAGADGNAVMVLPANDFGKSSYTFYYVSGEKIFYGTNVSVAGAVEVSTLKEATAKTYEGNFSGTLAFLDGENVFTFATSGDYKVTVPSSVSKIYAVSGTQVYLGDIKTDDNGKVSFELGSGSKATGTVKWSSVKFEGLQVTVNISGLEFSIVTDDNGSYSFVVPKDVEAKFTVSKDNAGYKFADENSEVLSVDKEHKTLTGKHTLAPASVLKIEDDIGLGTTTFKFNGKESEGVNSEGYELSSTSVSFSFGNYGSSDKPADTLYYSSGSYAYNPAVSSVKISALLGCATAEEAKQKVGYQSVYVDSATYEISFLYDGDGSYRSTGYSNDDGRQYVLKSSGSNYVLRAYDADAKKILLEKVGTETKMTVSGAKDAAEIEGFVGAVGSGEITLTTGEITITRTITDGIYKATVPAGTYKVEYTVTSGSESYSGSVASLEVSTGTYNFTAHGGSTYTELAAKVEGTSSMKTVTADIAEGALKNTTDKTQTYKISAGAGWTTFAVMNGDVRIDSITLEAGKALPKLSIVGTYNSGLYKLSSTNMLITLDADTDMFIVLTDETAVSEGLGVYVNKVADTAGLYSYSYSFEVNNLDSKIATFNINGIKDVTGWKVNVTAESIGEKLVKIYEVTGGSVKDLKLYSGINKFSITYIPDKNATHDDIPKLEGISLAFNGKVQTATPDEVTVNGSSATVKADPASADVGVSSSKADGRGVINDKGDVPVIVWVLAAIVILLAILVVWMAMKRGVFARRK